MRCVLFLETLTLKRNSHPWKSEKIKVTWIKIDTNLVFCYCLNYFITTRSPCNSGVVHLSSKMSSKKEDLLWMQSSVRVEPAAITCSSFSTSGNIFRSSVWTMWLVSSRENTSPSSSCFFEMRNIFKFEIPATRPNTNSTNRFRTSNCLVLNELRNCEFYCVVYGQ